MGKNKATTHLGKKKERKETQMPECDTHRVWRSRTNGNEEEEEEEEEAGIRKEHRWRRCERTRMRHRPRSPRSLRRRRRAAASRAEQEPTKHSTLFFFLFSKNSLNGDIADRVFGAFSLAQKSISVFKTILLFFFFFLGGWGAQKSLPSSVSEQIQRIIVTK